MNRPSPEAFANAPLFLPYVIAPEDDRVWTDYSGDRIILEGFALTREPIDNNGMRFLLEGHAIMDVLPRVKDGVPTWVGTLYDETVHEVANIEAAGAATEFAGMIHGLLRQRDDGLVFHMESKGVHIGQEPVRIRYLDEDEDERDEGDFDEGGYGGELAEAPQRFGEPVRIVRQGFQAWVEGRDAQEPWGAVRETFARAAEDGTALCPASYPITTQIDVLDGHAADVARHRVDLRSLRGLVGDPSEIMDMNLRAGVHVFDMVDSDARDAVVPQASIKAFHEERNARWEAQINHRQAVYDAQIAGAPEPEAPAGMEIDLIDPTALPAPRQAARPLGEIMREQTGYSPGSFTEVASMPTYMREQIRAIGRYLLAPHIGDMPMERVVIGRPSSSDPESYAAFKHFFAEGELVKDVPPMTHPSMPGYTTSKAEVRRRDGWDALVFTDFQGTYAYAFPSPEPKADLTPQEPEEEAPAFGM